MNILNFIRIFVVHLLVSSPPFDLCVSFLDFGLLCRMEKKHQFAMLASIVHIVNGDWASLVYALGEMDIVRPGTNIRHIIWV